MSEEFKGIELNPRIVLESVLRKQFRQDTESHRLIYSRQVGIWLSDRLSVNKIRYRMADTSLIVDSFGDMVKISNTHTIPTKILSEILGIKIERKQGKGGCKFSINGQIIELDADAFDFYLPDISSFYWIEWIKNLEVDIAKEGREIIAFNKSDPSQFIPMVLGTFD